MRSVAALTPASFNTAAGLSSECVGIIRQNSASVRSSGLDNIFNVDMKLVFTGLNF